MVSPEAPEWSRPPSQAPPPSPPLPNTQKHRTPWNGCFAAGECCWGPRFGDRLLPNPGAGPWPGLRPFLPEPTLSIPQKRNRDTQRLKRTPEPLVSGRAGAGPGCGPLPPRTLAAARDSGRPCRSPPGFVTTVSVHLDQRLSQRGFGLGGHVAMSGAVGTPGRYRWHLVGRARGAANHPRCSHDRPPPARALLSKFPIVPGSATQTQRDPGWGAGDQETRSSVKSSRRGIWRKCTPPPCSPVSSF